MKIEKFARKYQTWILGSIVALTALSLVITFAPGSIGGQQENDGKPAGEFKDRFGNTIKVSRDDYNKQRTKTLAFELWRRNLLSQQNIRFPNPPDEKQIHKDTWEDIILLRDAELNNVYVEDADVQGQILDIFEQLFRGHPTREAYESSIYGLGVTPEILEEAVRDKIKIDNLLSMLASSAFPDYGGIVKDFEQENKLAKIKFVALDPKDFEDDLPQPSESQIEEYFNKHNKEFEIASKIQVDYIFVDIEKVKDTISEPTQGEIEKYYEQNKSSYEIKEENPQATEKKYKPIDQVKTDIVTKLKEKNAATKAYEIAKQINLAIGNELSTTSSDKVNLKTIAESNNALYDKTPFIDKGRIPDIEKIVGNRSQIDSIFSFTKGDISKVVNTTKGSVIYRLLETKDAYTPNTLLDEIMEKVSKAVQEEEAQKFAKKRAEEISDEINKNGCEKVAQKYNIVFESFGYFDKTGKADKASGPAKSVDSALISKAFTLKEGEASYVEIGEKLNVLYLEDIRPIFENIDEKLEKARKDKLNTERGEAMQKIRRQIVEIDANLQDYISVKTK